MGKKENEAKAALEEVQGDVKKLEEDLAKIQGLTMTASQCAATVKTYIETNQSKDAFSSDYAPAEPNPYLTQPKKGGACVIC